MLRSFLIHFRLQKKTFLHHLSYFLLRTVIYIQERIRAKYPLTGDQNAGVGMETLHVVESSISYGKNVWWAFVEFFSSIFLHIFIIVDVDETIWIDRYNHFADICVDL